MLQPRCLSAVSSEPRASWHSTWTQAITDSSSLTRTGRSGGQHLSSCKSIVQDCGVSAHFPKGLPERERCCFHARLRPLWCSAGPARTGKSSLCFHAPTGLCPSRRNSVMLIEGDTVLFPLVYSTLSVFFVNIPYLFKC